AYSSEIKESIAHGGLAFPFVWKSAQYGYDGKGVKIIRSEKDLEGLPNVECITEELIDFENELAVIVARNQDGNEVAYPVVEMEFHPEANQVEYVICPARIPDSVAEKARDVALKVSRQLAHVGLLAVEMFQTRDNEILVNEMAPRPHNSGHYSIEASYTNQFEQHIRAILNLPLGNTDSKVAGVMVNLVGAAGHTGAAVYEHIEEILKIEGVTPHIYGKRETRPFRKMGHVTIVNEDMDTAREIAETVKNTIRVISN
ncbi:MAG: ATP-grasp domain-containing protein, partial [Eudoraea sp.]|nr:ATP-grasp domain-containing protein [Eudoraea sp.]